ncbi:MAG: hypothetical protein NC078_03945 [Ruminococcus sp.]|nr:hypothetical protein [Ruminococcus sp.]
MFDKIMKVIIVVQVMAIVAVVSFGMGMKHTVETYDNFEAELREDNVVKIAVDLDKVHIGFDRRHGATVWYDPVNDMFVFDECDSLFDWECLTLTD